MTPTPEQWERGVLVLSPGERQALSTFCRFNGLDPLRGYTCKALRGVFSSLAVERLAASFRDSGVEPGVYQSLRRAAFELGLDMETIRRNARRWRGEQ